MTLSKFLTYWSLTFAILVIWIFSVAVAMADVKDEMLAKIQKQWSAKAKGRLRPIDPLADRSVAETLRPPGMTDTQAWVFHLVSDVTIALKLHVKILVLQDSMGHYLVHFAQGKRLVSYRVDKAWVTDALAGKADQRDRIYAAVEQYLRQEFLGQPIVPKPAAPAAPKAPAAVAAAPAGTVKTTTGSPPLPAQPHTAGGSGSAPAAAQTPAGATPEMTREEKIAAAKAKAEAIKAQRAAGGNTGTGSGGSSPPGS